MTDTRLGTTLYPCAYMLTFFSSLPEDGVRPCEMQVYSLHRAVMASKDLAILAPAFAATAPPSHYYWLVGQNLIAAGYILALLRHKAMTDHTAASVLAKDISVMRQGLQQFRQNLNGGLPPTNAPADTSFAAPRNDSPPGTSSKKASPAKRGRKGSKAATPRKSSASQTQQEKVASKVVPGEDQDPDSSLTTISSDNDAPGSTEVEQDSQTFFANGLVAAAAAALEAEGQCVVDVAPSAEVPSDVDELADDSMDSTLNLVKEALASAPVDRVETAELSTDSHEGIQKIVQEMTKDAFCMPESVTYPGGSEVGPAPTAGPIRPGSYTYDIPSGRSSDYSTASSYAY